MATGADTSLMSLVIRMVVPMRREFGQSLDVQQFLRDPDYARTLLDLALASSDTRLRDYAQLVSQHLGGVRPANPPPQAAPAPEAKGAAAPADGEPTEAELRARMLKRYTGGLR